MTSDSPGIGTRLKRLPGQFLVALLNATSILVIAACVLVIVVLNRVDTAGARIAASVTEATFSKMQISPAEFKTRLVALDQRIELLSERLSNPELQQDGELKQQLTELNRNLTDLRQAAETIRSAGPEVTSTAFEQAGDMVTDSLYALRGCRSNDARPEAGS
ncbi:hypothetical protein ABLO27_09735 [Roseibium sp. SCPC15]|uniref:hypothetical protein n=1 Tax=Roseibium sp. SCP15 TaxID=3141376 RepID=UPI00333760C7